MVTIRTPTIDIKMRIVSQHLSVSFMKIKAIKAANHVPDENRRQLLSVSGIIANDAY